MSRAQDVDRFYRILEELSECLGGPRMLGERDGTSGWPEQGVYFFFEHGEVRVDGNRPRVTRVGTHAVSSGSRTTLWQRLSQHKGSTTGALPAGGNHRGSVFRKHVGSALLVSGDYPGKVRRTWERKRVALSSSERRAEHQLEVDVSAYLRAMPFLWLGVPGPASSETDRAIIERNSIALLSNLDREAVDPPSPGWLGRHAGNKVVRAAGLWNVRNANEGHDPKFFLLLQRYVSSMR